ncbi:uncharacterized protein BDZ83DRAFT_625492 [Colletotrichum acutatum]|uniref:Secreted protein n=1 Tax=Glomerella acutata TaxID=27357 RepID=A0AAD8XHQ0_GLOAC|nr:uncharacterized protein BDZ83DRAFT_625492 [Colletotrichum acutatum]KAK1723735.1 hypothetical protein BDZ83DRAFT_625492 [Colletotrichum acutatum]
MCPRSARCGGLLSLRLCVCLSLSLDKSVARSRSISVVKPPRLLVICFSPPSVSTSIYQTQISGYLRHQDDGPSPSSLSHVSRKTSSTQTVSYFTLVSNNSLDTTLCYLTWQILRNHILGGILPPAK